VLRRQFKMNYEAHGVSLPQLHLHTFADQRGISGSEQ
jgi:hypothetical protein